MTTKSIKIAAVTDDGITISQHFGRARYYEVITVENGVVISSERRSKTGHHTFAGNESGHNHEQNERHGFDSNAQNKHRSMAESIKDCQVLLARGMGEGAYVNMQEYGIKPIVTDIENIDNAVQAVINNTIINHIEKLD
ncbi:MAG: NifB/NifX family molybdenum-iron cluster-binding protein [Candidatus Kapaibacteriota bacterium]